MTDTALIEDFRSFNRRWTVLLSLLDARLLDSRHTLPEARVLFELGRTPRMALGALREALEIDASFLTRVVRQLEQDGLVNSTVAAEDGRRRLLKLTPRGRSASRRLGQRSVEQLAAIVEPLPASDQRVLRTAMKTLQRLLPEQCAHPAVELRAIEPGDLGWVVQRHGEIYADEFGWNQDFEGLVAGVVADYHRHLDPRWENAWIATVDGVRAGCIFCCRKDAVTAQLRILLVESWARGHGLGERLVQACIGFAREAGYQRIVLWTNDVLAAARHLYQRAGFVLESQEPHHSFGVDLVGQTWALNLRANTETGSSPQG
jgi:DNA-binding MarR family transcriptional regulator/GNAT superfamily N-acetyltransferase